MKFEHGAVVMTDSETGKPYARFLSPMELNLVLGQLQALDGGALNAREVAPFIMRTTGVSQGDAERIAEKRAGLHVVAREGTQAFVDMANSATQPPAITDQLIGKRVTVPLGRVTGTGKIPGGVQHIAKPQPECKHEWIDSEGRTSSGVLCQKCGAYDLPAPPTGPNPIDQALIDAERMTRQKFCPHETVLAGVCIVCDKRVKHGQS